MKSQFVAKSVQEIQGTTTAVNIEIEQLKSEAQVDGGSRRQYWQYLYF